MNGEQALLHVPNAIHSSPTTTLMAPIGDGVSLISIIDIDRHRLAFAKYREIKILNKYS